MEKQLFFPEAWQWQVQYTPAEKRRRVRNRTSLASKAVEGPVLPDMNILHMMCIVGSKILPKGHSRRKRDTPDKEDINSMRWAMKRELDHVGHSEMSFSIQLKALISYGYIEQRQDSYGKRYRVSWYGQKKLQGN